MKDVWNRGEIPDVWIKSEMVPIYIYKQQGDVMECGSDRGIKLMERAVKVLERVVDKRSGRLLTSMECSFSPGKVRFHLEQIAKEFFLPLSFYEVPRTPY